MEDARHSYVIFEMDILVQKETYSAKIYSEWLIAESEGLSGDLHLRHFGNNYQVSSVKSGSGQPPDRAQICPYV